MNENKEWTRKHPIEQGRYWWYGANKRIRDAHNIDKPEIAEVYFDASSHARTLKVIFDNDQGDILSEYIEPFCEMFENPFWLKIEEPCVPEDEE
jgi:hypothetical protein